MKLAEIHAERAELAARQLEQDGPEQDRRAPALALRRERATRDAARVAVGYRRLLTRAARRGAEIVAGRLELQRERAERAAHAEIVAAGLVF